MNQKTISNNVFKGLQSSMHDAIIGGEIVRDIPSKTVYVSDASELSNFADMPAGTIAATYGFTGMWQLKPDGTWATVYAPAENAEAEE